MMLTVQEYVDMSELSNEAIRAIAIALAEVKQARRQRA